MDEHSAEDLAVLHDLLLKVKGDLEVMLADAAGQADTVELDQTAVGRISRIDAIQRQEMAKAQHRMAARRLTRVQQALVDFHDPEIDFGACRDCGEPIPLGRLHARPEALFCVKCAQERGG
jgi:DnaK suppressor protein